MIVMFETERRTASGEILPINPRFARWHERVNSGARFRLDFSDALFGGNGEPYLRLPLASEDEEGYTFAELALYLYNRNVGALLTQADKQVTEEADHMEVSFGDVVDFLNTGRMLDRVPATAPWGYADKFPEDYVGCDLYEPDLIVLPVGIRRNIEWLFGQVKASDVGIALIVAANGLQSLWCQYALDLDLTSEECQQIGSRLCWYLPRYYAALIMPTNQVKGYPIWPGRNRE